MSAGRTAGRQRPEPRRARGCRAAPLALLGALGLLLVALLAPVAAEATLLERMDVEELTQHAALIVEGTVLSTAVEQPGGEVRTAVRIEAERVLKGAPGQFVTCYVPGGVLPDGTRVICDGVPSFAVGEQCYVFVDVHGWVIAGFQGKLDVAGGRVAATGQKLAAMDARIRAAAGRGAAPPRRGTAAGTSSRRDPGRGSAADGRTTGGKAFAPSDWAGLWSGELEIGVSGQTATGVWHKSSDSSPDRKDFTGTISDLVEHGYSGDVVHPNMKMAGSWMQDYGNGNWQKIVYSVELQPNPLNDTVSFVGFCRDTIGEWDEPVWTMTKPGKVASGVNITSITPNEISAGTGSKIIIAGTGFGSGTGKVEFSYGFQNKQRTPADVISSWSDTEITCIVPARVVGNLTECASSGPVWVTTAAGAESEAFDGFTVTFAYVQSKWGQPAVTYQVNPTNSKLGGEFPGMRSAVDAAAATWTAVGTPFKLTAGDPTWHKCETGDGLNVVGWDELGTGYLALTWPTASNGTITECDFAFNSEYPWGTGGQEYDLQSAAVHEFGHWLYLGDLYGAADASKVMSGSLAPGTPKRDLSSDDIAGIRWVYAGGSSGPSKDTTKPVCEADDVRVRRGQWVLLRLRAYDEQSPQVRIWLDVLDRKGTTRREWDWGWRDSHKGWRGVGWQCTLPRGKYMIHVGAEDKAGNYGTATAILRVI